MGEHVVIEEVDIDGRDAPVQIGRDAEREHLAHPDREHDLEPEPPEAFGAPGDRVCRHAGDEACQLDCSQAETLHDHPAKQTDRECPPQNRKAGARRLQESGECEQAVLGSAGEHAAIARAAAKNSAPTLRVALLDEVGGAGPREMEF